jgi:catechol 2,3-dioxygenase-like lactoylglutathione lyase family enzyme
MHMTDTKLLHVALQTTNRKQTEQFFTKLLHIPKTRSFTLASHMAEQLFEDPQEMQIDVYQNAHAYIEVFEVAETKPPRYVHLCFEVKDCEKLINECKTQGLQVFEVTMNNKRYVFIKDHTGNRYEIKESSKV